jgi:hypothetical protein
MDSPLERRMILEAHEAAWQTNLTAWFLGGEIHLDDNPMPWSVLRKIPVDDVPDQLPLLACCNGSDC